MTTSKNLKELKELVLDYNYIWLHSYESLYIEKISDNTDIGKILKEINLIEMRFFGNDKEARIILNGADYQYVEKNLRELKTNNKIIIKNQIIDNKGLRNFETNNSDFVLEIINELEQDKQGQYNIINSYLLNIINSEKGNL